jgi:competence protein ComEA
MHNIRKWIRFLFGFSRKEINGFLILLPLMVLAIFSQPMYRMIAGRGPLDFSREALVLDSLQALIGYDADSGKRVQPIVDHRKFHFDPNAASMEQLVSLGFSTGVSTRIVHYRESGGQFRSRSDLLKIYGLDSGTFRQLYPLIDLPEHALETVSVKHQKRTRVDRHVKVFDLNIADSVVLVEVRGIGPVLATRIVRYREKLGGFIRKEQLFEVYRLDSTTVKELSKSCYISGDFVPRKIGLNDSDEYVLSGHPYISRALAKAIVAYRFQHGRFESIGEMLKIRHLEDSTFFKISPYLAID